MESHAGQAPSCLETIFNGKRVWLSGHTGFKGSWLALWLLDLGAEVYGFSLPPGTSPALFDQLGLAERLHHQIGDVRDSAAVRESIAAARPDFVFHLAAQPLVRASFEDPVQTYATNVMGTAHVLEALRSLTQACAAVFITTDKCYENREWVQAYREEDPLGGYDPYSSSKAAAEIAIASWRRSFFARHPVRIASCRAGNVIGGGDWAKDRIVPDCIRALRRHEAIGIRNKIATRPWQFVLEALSGYLWLAAVLSDATLRPYPAALYTGAFNFGPHLEANRTVEDLVREVLKHSAGEWEDRSDPHAVHEGNMLNLAIDKSFHLLAWKPVWAFERTVAQTVAWYHREGEFGAERLREYTSQQIREYQEDAGRAGLPWALAR